MYITQKKFLCAIGLLLFVYSVNGQGCKSGCPAGQACCPQAKGDTCFNTKFYDCVNQKQLCAKGASLCGTTCYDGAMYDCVGNNQLCPKGYQICGDSQCYNPKIALCQNGSYVLSPLDHPACGGESFDVSKYTCYNDVQNGYIGPMDSNSNCTVNQIYCDGHCYDPMLYGCKGNEFFTLPGYCGQGEVWCQGAAQCYNAKNYYCTSSGLAQYPNNQINCQSGQTECGVNGCYDPTVFNCLTSGPSVDVICPKGNEVCNSTCYNSSRYDCVNNGLVAHPGYCPGKLGLCGLECYDTTQYTCVIDIMIPIATGITCDTVPSVCPSSTQCCADPGFGTSCYNPANYDCVSGSKLCGEGLLVCGSRCYDPALYQCFANTLCPVGLSACTLSDGTSVCYDSSQFVCIDSDIASFCQIGAPQCQGSCYSDNKYVCNSTGLAVVVCGSAQQVCGSVCYSPLEYSCVNRTLVAVENPCADGFKLCGTQCYDPLKSQCVDGSVILKPLCADGLEVCATNCYDPNTNECINNQWIYKKCNQDYEQRCNVTCYDPSKQECVNEVLIGYTTTAFSATGGTTSISLTTGGTTGICQNGQLVCGNRCYNPTTQNCNDGVVEDKDTSAGSSLSNNLSLMLFVSVIIVYLLL